LIVSVLLTCVITAIFTALLNKRRDRSVYNQYNCRFATLWWAVISMGRLKRGSGKLGSIKMKDVEIA